MTSQRGFHQAHTLAALDVLAVEMKILLAWLRESGIRFYVVDQFLLAPTSKILSWLVIRKSEHLWIKSLDLPL